MNRQSWLVTRANLENLVDGGFASVVFASITEDPRPQPGSALNPASAVFGQKNRSRDSTPVPVRHLLLSAPGEDPLTAHPAVHE